MNNPNLTIEQEIALVNQLIANAIVHGGDAGGPFQVNTPGLVRAMKDWIWAKGLEETHHVITGLYLCELQAKDIRREENVAGYFPTFKIAPKDQKGIDDDSYDLEGID